MISSIEYLLNKNLFESSAAADNAGANSSLYYGIIFSFLLWCFLLIRNIGEKGEAAFWGDFLGAV